MKEVIQNGDEICKCNFTSNVSILKYDFVATSVDDQELTLPFTISPSRIDAFVAT
jgi:hypothetical protein